MSWVRTGRVLAGVILATLSGGLAPRASAPATRPSVAATPTAPPKEWVEVDGASHHFHFFVPKAWAQKVKTDTQATFELPHTAAMHPSVFTVVAAACHASTVEADAAETRDPLKAAVEKAGGKMTVDAATELAGRPAWAFEVQQPYEVPMRPSVTARPAPGAKPLPLRTVRRTTKMYEVLRAEGTMHYIVTFEADAQYYSAGLANVKRVLDLFAFDPTPAAQ